MEIEYKHLKAVLQEMALHIKQDFIQAVIANNKGGRIDKTVRADVTFLNNKYQVIISLPEYWKYVESGRKAGTFPNLTAIIKWISYKNILPKKDSKVRTKEQLAYLIGRSIKEKGIKPLPLLSKAIASNKKTFESQIEQALRLDVEDAMKSVTDNQSTNIK
jgi:hypothetical protein